MGLITGTHRRAFVALLALITPMLTPIGPAAYSEAPGDKDIGPQIEKLIQKSGMEAQLKSFYKLLAATMPSDAFPNHRMRRRAVDILREQAGEDVLAPIMVEAFRTDYDQEPFTRTTAFFDSRTGSKLGRLLSRSSQRLWPGKLLSKARKEAQGISGERARLLDRLIVAQKVGERNHELVIALLKGLLEEDIRVAAHSPKELRKRMEAVEDKVEDATRRSDKASLSLFAFALRTLNDEELRETVEFEESPAGLWFRSVAHGACLQVAQRAGEALAAAIGPREDNESTP